MAAVAHNGGGHQRAGGRGRSRSGVLLRRRRRQGSRPAATLEVAAVDLKPHALVVQVLAAAVAAVADGRCPLGASTLRLWALARVDGRGRVGTALLTRSLALRSLSIVLEVRELVADDAVDVLEVVLRVFGGEAVELHVQLDLLHLADCFACRLDVSIGELEGRLGLGELLGDLSQFIGELVEGVDRWAEHADEDAILVATAEGLLRLVRGLLAFDCATSARITSRPLCPCLRARRLAPVSLVMSCFFCWQRRRSRSSRSLGASKNWSRSSVERFSAATTSVESRVISERYSGSDSPDAFARSGRAMVPSWILMLMCSDGVILQ